MNLKPVIFKTADRFYKDLEQRYKRHAKGLFIVAPSASGKTYFCDRQSQPDWIDGDVLWGTAGADPFPFQWWNDGLQTIHRVGQRCDIITADAVDRGFWIIGSTNYWLKPHAIVIPSKQVLMRNLEARGQADHTYDGGLEKHQYQQLAKGMEEIRQRWGKEVPEFDSIDKAAKALKANL